MGKHKINYYGINNYGELTMIKSAIEFKAWDKLVCEEPTKKGFPRFCSPKRKLKKECQLLHMTHKEIDPQWKWDFKDPIQ